MTTKLLIGNLPPEVTAEQVIELFKEAGAEIEVLKLSGESDSITATVGLNVDERTAQVMVDRARKDYFEGREISYYIPKFFR